MENMKIQNAASTIQKAIKSKKARAELKQNKELKTISDTVVDDMQNKMRKQQEPFIKAATKIQSTFRGHKGREETAIKLETKLKQKKMRDILSDRVSKNVIKNSLDKIIRKQAAENKMNHSAIKIQSAVRNRNALKELYKREDIRENKHNAINQARERYNQIGEMMMPRSFKSSDKLHSSANEFIQGTARDRIKKFQSIISEMDTRSKLSEPRKNEKIKTAQAGIARMDNIIKKKSQVGRPRTRTPAEEAGSRLSMLSTTSTRAAMTPKKNMD